MIILLLFFSTGAFAESKASFFPRLSGGQIIEERIIGKKKLERSLERRNDTYRFVVNWESLSKISRDVAYPIHQLSQYGICSLYGSQPLQVNIHLEAIWVDTHFKCVTPAGYDPVKLRKDLQDKYCASSTIRSEAQDIICKELMLK